MLPISRLKYWVVFMCCRCRIKFSPLLIPAPSGARTVSMQENQIDHKTRGTLKKKTSTLIPVENMLKLDFVAQ